MKIKTYPKEDLERMILNLKFLAVRLAAVAHWLVHIQDRNAKDQQTCESCGHIRGGHKSVAEIPPDDFQICWYIFQNVVTSIQPVLIFFTQLFHKLRVMIDLYFSVVFLQQF